MENNNFCLPEDIIQHIQSFLSAKEAARTSVLSKSWYTAWSTRSNLVFYQRDFGRNDDGFWEFTEKTMQRSDELNLRIQSLRFSGPFQEHYSNFLIDKLTARAMKLGATDFNFEFTRCNWACVLPREVLGSKTLIRLSVTGGKIVLGEDRKASYSSLKSLSLRFVDTEGDVIWNIISSCPLIEKLSLCHCFVVPTSNDDRYLLARPFDKLSGLDVNGRMKGFSKLKYLFLQMVHIDTSFFDDFSSKFPCLKDLSVHHCADGYDGIRIDSSSLECLSFGEKGTMLMAEFDVPCIRKFVYHGCSLPSLSFKEYSRVWKLDISLNIDSIHASWFLELKRSLAKLSRLKISLALSILIFWDSSSSILNSWDDDLGSPIVVEDLILVVRSSISSSFLDGLFWSCHPKLITRHFSEENISFLELFCMTLIRKVSIQGRSNVGLHDLEKVASAEVFNESLAEWQPLPLMTLLGSSKVVSAEILDKSLAEWQPLLLKTLLASSKTLLDSSMCSEYKLRFQLRWE